MTIWKQAETRPMRRDDSQPNQFSTAALELSDLELKTVAGGASAKTVHPNINRFDPYKSFHFRLT